jgi:putative flippase GtrA
VSTQGTGPQGDGAPVRQWLLFLLAGGTAAAANFFSRVLYSQWLGYSTAVILAYLTGMLIAFPLFRRFVFTRSSQPWLRSALLFGAVNLLAVVQTWAVSMGLRYVLLPRLGVLHFVPEISHAVGIVVPVFSSFMGHKHASFR